MSKVIVFLVTDSDAPDLNIGKNSFHILQECKNDITEDILQAFCDVAIAAIIDRLQKQA